MTGAGADAGGDVTQLSGLVWTQMSTVSVAGEDASRGPLALQWPVSLTAGTWGLQLTARPFKLRILLVIIPLVECLLCPLLSKNPVQSHRTMLVNEHCYPILQKRKI